MNRVVIIVLAVAIQSVHGASMEGSKKLAIQQKQAMPVPMADEPTPTISKTPAMDEIRQAWFGDKNTLMVGREVAHQHPTMASDILEGKRVNPFDGCYVAQWVLSMIAAGPRLSMPHYHLRLVVESLKEVPSAAPVGCDGTTCYKLIDKAQIYAPMTCTECARTHTFNEHCCCMCSCALCCQYRQQHNEKSEQPTCRFFYCSCKNTRTLKLVPSWHKDPSCSSFHCSCKDTGTFAMDRLVNKEPQRAYIEQKKAELARWVQERQKWLKPLQAAMTATTATTNK